MNSKRRVLLIGGSGFLGRHLCLRLLAENITPVVFDKAPPPVEDVEYYCGEMSTTNTLDASLLEGIEAVYHLAWTSKPQTANNDPASDLEENVVPGLHLLDSIVQLRHRPRLIFISTGGAVYGAMNSFPIKEDDLAEPMNAYGIGKLTFEHYIRLYNHLHGLDYLVFRPGNPYGKFQNPEGSQGAVAVFMGKLIEGKPVNIWGDGEIVRDYLYIDDLISAFISGLSYQPTIGQQRRVFNVGSGIGMSLNQLLTQIESVSGKRFEVLYTSSHKADVPKVVLNIESIKRCMGWEPEITIEQGLKKTWEWMLASR